MKTANLHRVYGKNIPKDIEIKGHDFKPVDDFTPPGKRKQAEPIASDEQEAPAITKSPAENKDIADSHNPSDINETNRVTESQSYRPPDSVSPNPTKSLSNEVTESVSDRVTEFDDYIVPDYRKLKRFEMRLTWEQKKFLDDLESIISRDMPEGERANPNYKRITKNSIIRSLVEITRRLEINIDASHFTNERDLTKALSREISRKITELQTNRVTESVSDKVSESGS